MTENGFELSSQNGGKLTALKCGGDSAAFVITEVDCSDEELAELAGEAERTAREKGSGMLLAACDKARFEKLGYTGSFCGVMYDGFEELYDKVVIKRFGEQPYSLEFVPLPDEVTKAHYTVVQKSGTDFDEKALFRAAFTARSKLRLSQTRRILFMMVAVMLMAAFFRPQMMMVSGAGLLIIGDMYWKPYKLSKKIAESGGYRNEVILLEEGIVEYMPEKPSMTYFFYTNIREVYVKKDFVYIECGGGRKGGLYIGLHDEAEKRAITDLLEKKKIQAEKNRT